MAQRSNARFAVERHNFSVSDSVKPDAIRSDSLANDSLSHDSVGVNRKNQPLEAPVEYTANDSIVYEAGKGFAHLYGKSKVSYQNITLEADQISMNIDSSTVFAQGMPDSLGVMNGLPVFTDGDTPYNAETAAKDRDFWDWYVRRLLNDPMYRRDFAAQKSFSKLRAAIAGLYSRQGRRADAAQAFREAVLLYPASPEAVFRYIQEVLISAKRWDAALESLDYNDHLDPNNKRTEGLRDYVPRLRAMSDEVESLESRRRTGAELSVAENYRLAQCYYSLGRVMEAAQVIRKYVDTASSPEELKAISTITFEAGLASDAERSLEKYLKLVPQADPAAWLRLSRLQFRSGRRQAALRSFQMAAMADREGVVRQLQSDQELQDIAAPLLQQRRK